MLVGEVFVKGPNTRKKNEAVGRRMATKIELKLMEFVAWRPEEGRRLDNAEDGFRLFLESGRYMIKVKISTNVNRNKRGRIEVKNEKRVILR